MVQGRSRAPDGRHFHIYGESHGTLDAQPSDTGYDVRALHRRFDRLTGAWVLVSPARNNRPGGLAHPTTAPVCPLCPGGPELPWPYDVAVFDNRFPSLSADAPCVNGALQASSIGRCQVVVYTPEHHGSLASLSPQQIVRVMTVWRDRSAALWSEGHRCVMAAGWPCEVHIRAIRHGLGRLSEPTDVEVRDLAVAVRSTVTRLDGLFGFEMPLMLAVQEAPAVEPGDPPGGEPDWHLHASRGERVATACDRGGPGDLGRGARPSYFGWLIFGQIVRSVRDGQWTTRCATGGKPRADWGRHPSLLCMNRNFWGQACAFRNTA